MSRRTLVLRSLFAALLCATSVGAQAASPAIDPTDQGPWGIELLPGYKHFQEQGIDTSVGRIAKGERTVIRYDIGTLAGLHVDPDKKAYCGRYAEEDVGGQAMRLCVTGNTFTLVFVEASANFYGQAQDERELFDLIHMVKTFKGPHRVPPKR
jgi:hypothetical protein